MDVLRVARDPDLVVHGESDAIARLREIVAAADALYVASRRDDRDRLLPVAVRRYEEVRRP